ncbi:uncharacterized protein N7482_001493 [Penicillium canariense]|uniref:Uncharacterized protein n=1 Tax=Penicillium canariense TaxID=189055 RepID=A0A9W9IJU3_9EURO|nr:uncharacterized protein N7482_001493 [Penicillium canariense]KAJ5175616.1 hypothetical protein N7482_001493 [Penicillium canariense]
MMAGLLVLGVLSAIAQDLIFRHYQGRVVATDDEQKWVGRVGTGLAFLVKSLLVTASTTAYVQHLWLVVRDRPTSITTLDAMFDALGNALSLGRLGIWTARPLLLLIAGITWLLPLAAVVTPSALSIASVLRVSYLMVQVPQLAFNSPIFANLDDSNRFRAANILVTRLSLSSATHGTILPIPAHYPNSSYTLDFYGPGLSCQTANDTETQALDYDLFGHGISGAIYYYSWFGPSVAYWNQSLEDGLDYNSNDSSRFWVGLISPSGESNQLYECALMNISYSVDFAFNSGTQNLMVRRNQEMNGIPTVQNTSGMSSMALASQSLMYVMDQIITGEIGGGAAGSLIFTSTTVQTTNLAQVNPLCGQMAGDTDGAQYFGACQNSSFSAALEELFQNMTLSLLSNEYFWENNSTPVNTTVVTSELRYIYHPLDLWIPYGVAILCTLLCIGLGVWSVVKSGLSYSNGFSTILRSTRDRSIDQLVVPDELGGQDPLPRRLATTKLIFMDENDQRLGFHVWTERQQSNEA